MGRYIRPPVLRDWLASIGAKNTFQLTQAGRLVELWSANGRVFLVVVNANGGWEIFTACDSIKIDDTLRDAERRLGIPHPDKDT